MSGSELGFCILPCLDAVAVEKSPCGKGKRSLPWQPQRKLKKGKKDKKGKNSFFEDLATDGKVEAEEPAVKETQGKQKKKKDRWKGRAGDPDNDDDDEQIMQRLKRLLVAMAARLGAAALSSPFRCFFLVFLNINSFFNCDVSWANPVYSRQDLISIGITGRK
ncbi:unnamed protein product [Arctogadus glacialis]